MPDHFETIYASRAPDYDRLIQREDYQGNILRALRSITSLEGIAVAEMGAGTGRLTRLLSPHVANLIALDSSAHMLQTASSTLRPMGFSNWMLAQADNRAVPLARASVDMAIEGWSFGHLTGWYPDTWRGEMRRAMAEMERIVRPGGVAILLETLGTGRETPLAPADSLAAFYQMLESELGYSAQAIRTDYRFATVEEAVELIGFFFGAELAERIRTEQTVILPECTGIWWRHL